MAMLPVSFLGASQILFTLHCMHSAVTKVLFVGAENQGRSLLAEACLNQVGQGKFRAFSCGMPKLSNGTPHSWTLLALRTAGMPSSGLKCKGWAEFTRSGAVKMDFVIAMDAATIGEHPHWPGQPVCVTWDYPRIGGYSANGVNAGIVALNTLHSLRSRLELLVNLHPKISRRSELLHDLRDMAQMPVPLQPRA